MNRDHLPSLLLLPYPPQPASRICLNAAYHPSLAAALSRSRHPNRSTTLIVAVTCPILTGISPWAKTLEWSEAQSLLAGLYSIISVICAKESIATDIGGGPGSVDTRVVLVDHDRKRRFEPDRPNIETNSTIVVDLPTFAAAYHPWNFIYHTNSESGYAVFQTYLKFAEGAQKLFQNQFVAVEGGVHMNIEMKGSQPSSVTERPNTYSQSCLGGTFDHLHPGHKLLLTAAAILLKVPRVDRGESSLLVIGVTGDELLKNKKYAEYMQSWEDRTRNVIDFLGTLFELSSLGWKQRATPQIDERPGEFRASFRDGTISVLCVEIQDPFGPTITMESLGALALSAETRSGGPPINEKRMAAGWKPMEIFEVDVLDAEEIEDEASSQTENFAAKISSTAIRKQKADANSKI
jgi:phosphopantetheine adenylyltransferase